MPVKIYVQFGATGSELPPTHTHESEAALSIIKQIWSKYADQPTVYAVGINLHRPSADFVIISERGIGVIDLKDYPGAINGTPTRPWTYHYGGETKRIDGGTEHGKKRINPHEQVIAYSNKISQILAEFNQLQPLADRWDPNDVNNFFINKAVCFTNPNAIIEIFRENYYPLCTRSNLIKILKPEEVPDWAFCISLHREKRKDDRGRTTYKRHVLSETQISNFATDRYTLGLVESKEILGLMPEVEPYGWLIRIQDGRVKKNESLDRHIVNIGRSPSCQISLNRDFHYVSGEHARISKRISDGKVAISTLNANKVGGSNGTFVTRGEKTVEVLADKPLVLRPGDTIKLGGKADRPGVCVLRYSLESPPTPGTTVNPN